MSHVTIGKESSTDLNLKDYWRTSPLAYSDACYLCGVDKFNVDLAAKSENESKCEAFVSEDMDALKSPIDIYGLKLRSCWLNPPFSKKVEFLKMVHESDTIGLCCVMIPYEPCTKWFRENVHNKASVVFVPDGRYNFMHPETNKEIKGVNFACCFAVFNGIKMPTSYVHFERGIGLKSNDK